MIEEIILGMEKRNHITKSGVIDLVQKEFDKYKKQKTKELSEWILQITCGCIWGDISDEIEKLL